MKPYKKTWMNLQGIYTEQEKKKKKTVPKGYRRYVSFIERF